MNNKTVKIAKHPENLEFIPIFIEFLDYEVDVDDEYHYHYLDNQTIFLNSNYLCEFNKCSLEYWTIEMYEQQWQGGLERLKTHDSSCLINSIPNPLRTDATVNAWILYKIGENIHIQNHYFSYDKYGNKNITPENCYNFFIKPRKIFTGDGLDKISEWVVPITHIPLKGIGSLEDIKQIVAKQEFDKDIARQLTKELTNVLGL